MTDMKRPRLYRLVLSLAAALTFSIGLPNEIFLWGLPFPAFFALAFLFTALWQADNAKEGAFLGFVFGFANSLTSNYWLFFFQNYKYITLLAASLGIAGQCALACGYVQGVAQASGRLRFLFTALAWTAYEFFKSVGFLGFPWALIAYPIHNFTVFIQAADVLGVFGLSFVLAVINAAIAETALQIGSLKQARQAVITAGALFVLLIGYGLIRLYEPMRSSYTAKLALVQQNMDTWDASAQELLQAHIEAADKIPERFEPDLIVGSEAILLKPYDKDDAFFAAYPREKPFLAFLQEKGVHQLIGAPLVESNGVQNGVLLLSPNGEQLESYGKRQLVPYAESVPFMEFPPFFWFMKNVIGFTQGWAIGQRGVVFKIPIASGGEMSFSTPICFEDAFGWVSREAVRNGADLFVNITNDSWSKTVSAETQHMVVAKFRTVESRRGMVRAANGGITGYVDVKGRLVSQLPPFTAGVLTVEAELFNKITPLYVYWGDWFPIAAYLAVAAALAYAVYTSQQQGFRLLV